MYTSNNNSHKYSKSDDSLESLQYDSLFSSKEYKIDSKGNLHITEQSSFKHRNDTVPLDMINPQPVCKKQLSKPLTFLAISSVVVSSLFIASAIVMGQIWAIAFAIVFGTFGIGALLASFKNRTTVYQYKFANSDTTLFSLIDNASKDQQVTFFSNSLNRKIILLNKKNELQQAVDNSVNVKDVKQWNNISDDSIYEDNKKSQYMKHLDFLFNHGIVDELLYKRLHMKINLRIAESENRFATQQLDNSETFENMPDNVINFPVNA